MATSEKVVVRRVPLAVPVEDARAQRLERQQSRFRDRGGIFVPTNTNLLTDILLSRTVNGETPTKRREMGSSPTRRRSARHESPTKSTLSTNSPKVPPNTSKPKVNPFKSSQDDVEAGPSKASSKKPRKSVATLAVAADTTESPRSSARIRAKSGNEASLVSPKAVEESPKPAPKTPKAKKPPKSKPAPKPSSTKAKGKKKKEKEKPEEEAEETPLENVYVAPAPSRLSAVPEEEEPPSPVKHRGYFEPQPFPLPSPILPQTQETYQDDEAVGFDNPFLNDDVFGSTMETSTIPPSNKRKGFRKELDQVVRDSSEEIDDTASMQSASMSGFKVGKKELKTLAPLVSQPLSSSNGSMKKAVTTKKKGKQASDVAIDEVLPVSKGKGKSKAAANGVEDADATITKSNQSTKAKAKKANEEEQQEERPKPKAKKRTKGKSSAEVETQDEPPTKPSKSKKVVTEESASGTHSSTSTSDEPPLMQQSSSIQTSSKTRIKQKVQDPEEPSISIGKKRKGPEADATEEAEEILPSKKKRGVKKNDMGEEDEQKAKKNAGRKRKEGVEAEETPKTVKPKRKVKADDAIEDEPPSKRSKVTENEPSVTKGKGKKKAKANDDDLPEMEELVIPKRSKPAPLGNKRLPSTRRASFSEIEKSRKASGSKSRRAVSNPIVRRTGPRKSLMLRLAAMGKPAPDGERDELDLLS